MFRPTTMLPLNEINVLAVTDLHGWIAGQHARHLPHLNVDIGDLLSFFERLRQQHDASGRDFFLLFNGDFMDGTGLSTIPPKYLTSLLQDAEFSAINLGNHELYENEVIDYLVQPNGFISFWNGTFLTSNTDLVVRENNNITTSCPLGSRYTILHGKHSNVLVFGFLYNFQNSANHARVKPVEDALQEEWLQHALLHERYDAIVVMAHMDAVDPLVDKIRLAIRDIVGSTMPIQFLTGHTHRRHFQTLDPLSTTLEAGRFLDTIGFASFPKQSTVEEYDLNDTQSEEPPLFKHAFLDANQEVLRQSLGFTKKDFSTPRGRALSLKMAQTQELLGLDHVLTSCAPSTYYPLFAPLNDTESLWWLYLREVIPKTLFPRLENPSSSDNGVIRRPIFLQGTGALRYPLWGPNVVVDDIIAVTPFASPIYQVGADLDQSQLQRVLIGIGAAGPSMDFEFQNLLPSFGVAGNLTDVNDDDKVVRYDLYTVQFHLKQIVLEVLRVLEQDGRHRYFSPLPRAVFGDRKDQGNQPLGTTDLWMRFVQVQWKCHYSEERRHAEKPSSSYDEDGIDSELKVNNQLILQRAMVPSHHTIQDAATTKPVVFVFVLLGVFSTIALRRAQRRMACPPGSQRRDDHGAPLPSSEMAPLLRNDSAYR